MRRCPQPCVHLDAVIADGNSQRLKAQSLDIGTASGGEQQMREWDLRRVSVLMDLRDTSAFALTNGSNFGV